MLLRMGFPPKMDLLTCNKLQVPLTPGKSKRGRGPSLFTGIHIPNQLNT